MTSPEVTKRWDAPPFFLEKLIDIFGETWYFWKNDVMINLGPFVTNLCRLDKHYRDIPKALVKS